jgi:hypothetical protein
VLSIKLDTALFSAAQIAEVANLDLVTVNTWTSRGLFDPDKSAQRVRLGRGHARKYSLCDGLRFSLMRYLHKQYSVPLPQGAKICRMIFEGFNPAKTTTKVAVLTISTSVLTKLAWEPTLSEAMQHLERSPLATVINVGLIWSDVSARAQQLFADS